MPDAENEVLLERLSEVLCDAVSVDDGRGSEKVVLSVDELECDAENEMECDSDAESEIDVLWKGDAEVEKETLGDTLSLVDRSSVKECEADSVIVVVVESVSETSCVGDFEALSEKLVVGLSDIVAENDIDGDSVGVNVCERLCIGVGERESDNDPLGVSDAENELDGEIVREPE